MAPKLAMDVAVTKIKRNARLESCSFAIFLTSSGCDVDIISQSNIIIVKAQPIQVTKIKGGVVILSFKQKNTIALTANDINNR